MAEPLSQIITTAKDMQAKGAKEGDVLNYLKQNGINSKDEYIALRDKFIQQQQQAAPAPGQLPGPQQPQQPVATGEDIARSGAAGVGTGLLGTIGAVGDFGDMGGQLRQWLGGSAPVEYTLPFDIPYKPPTTAGLVKQADEALGGDSFLTYQPQTTAGEIAKTAGEFAPSLLQGRPNPRALIQRGVGVLGATAGTEGLGRLAEGTPLETPARIVGGVVGGVAGHRVAAPRPTPGELLARHAPGDLTRYDELGPDAMTFQASPSTEGLAQGVAARPGRGRDILQQAIDEQRQGRPRRLNEDVTGVTGPARNATTEGQRIIDEAVARGAPLQREAIANAPQLPSRLFEDIISPELTSDRVTKHMSARRRASATFDEIDDALMADNPQEVGARLLDYRQRLGRNIEWGPRSKVADPALNNERKDAYKIVDDILKNRFPDAMRQGDEIIARGHQQVGDIDFGREVLDTSPNAMWPDQFRREMANRSSAPGGPRNPDMVRTGTQHDIRTAIGTTPNDLAALRRKVGGEGDFNREKINELYGPGASEQLAAGVTREEQLARSGAKVTEGSQTAQREAAQRELGRENPLEVSSGATLTGIGLKTAAALSNALTSGGWERWRQTTQGRLAEALIMRGPAGRAALEEAQRARGRVSPAVTAALVNALLSTTEGRARMGH